MVRRRRDGELAAGHDPARITLAVFAVGMAPLTFPHLARAVGLDPDAPDLATFYAAHVAEIVARLRER